MPIKENLHGFKFRIVVVVVMLNVVLVSFKTALLVSYKFQSSMCLTWAVCAYCHSHNNNIKNLQHFLHKYVYKKYYEYRFHDCCTNSAFTFLPRVLVFSCCVFFYYWCIFHHFYVVVLKINTNSTCNLNTVALCSTELTYCWLYKVSADRR